GLRLARHALGHRTADPADPDRRAEHREPRTDRLTELREQTRGVLRVLGHGILQHSEDGKHVVPPCRFGDSRSPAPATHGRSPAAPFAAPPLPGPPAARLSPATRRVRYDGRSEPSRPKARHLRTDALARPGAQCACRINPMKTDVSIAKM